MKFSAVLYLFTLASVSAAAAIDPSSGQGADGTLAKRSSGRKSECERILDAWYDLTDTDSDSDCWSSSDDEADKSGQGRGQKRVKDEGDAGKKQEETKDVAVKETEVGAEATSSSWYMVMMWH
ncbi:hypothetical protein MCOR07_005683 [Pyricularia oryzae]|nr:hypothetical protein MCOR22_011109 [Pyricularia oryzae]KAI6620026.1 hypothetical protein MCOR07_005683 [Pyricularia oryzae]